MSLVYLLYGLAFFSMGLIVVVEGGRSSDERLRHALRPLAVFGLVHGVHEWVEMFYHLDLLPAQSQAQWLWLGIRLAMLSFSFLSLAAFGASLLSPTARVRRVSLLLPLLLAAVWSMGLLVMRGTYIDFADLWAAADGWSRYVLAVPAALVACTGLLAQQRAFRHAGMAEFGRDSLWAAVAFGWYGLVGQIFTEASPLLPATLFNYESFIAIFGFPVQLLRAVSAGAVALFIVRSLRAFEVETQRQIRQLQVARLEEAERREALRGRMFAQVVAAQEMERQRVARELHDETGQALTAIGLGLRGVATTLGQDAKVATQNLRRLEGLVDDALDELQRLIADLRPSHLDDLGLAATVRWWINSVHDRTSLPIRLEISGQERPLATPLRLAMFRIVQEALTNVVKHSQATAVDVRLLFGELDVEVCVKDNGCGFNVHQSNGARRPSWGLLGMQERAALLGGHFQLISQPGSGTQVMVQMPYQPPVEELRPEVSDEYTPVTG
jgi:signal transduction histidine kinase